MNSMHRARYCHCTDDALWVDPQGECPKLGTMTGTSSFTVATERLPAGGSGVSLRLRHSHVTNYSRWCRLYSSLYDACGINRPL